MAVRIWLIRHGLTQLGEEKRYQGSLDDGLSEAGKSVLLPADFRPEYVYVSPARRARETAGILFPQARQIVCEDLREMNFGRFEGRGWWEMADDRDYRAWIDSDCAGQCPGGENRREFSARICAAFDSILRTEYQEGPAGKNIVIVAHGGTQMALLEKRGTPVREYYHWQRPCGCGWLLETQDLGRSLRVVREISFLK